MLILASTSVTAGVAALAQGPSPAGSGTLPAGPGMSMGTWSPAPSGPGASGTPSWDACALLDPTELQAATGIALPAGTLQTADSETGLPVDR